ncbi:MAG: NifU family protein [Cyclobacteriaceae bacterium]
MIDQNKVKEVIDSKIRPAIQMDGGNIELVSIDGSTIKVNLTGACAHCPASSYTLKMGVENMLKQEVSDEIVVEMA